MLARVEPVLLAGDRPIPDVSRRGPAPGTIQAPGHVLLAELPVDDPAVSAAKARRSSRPLEAREPDAQRDGQGPLGAERERDRRVRAVLGVEPLEGRRGPAALGPAPCRYHAA